MNKATAVTIAALSALLLALAATGTRAQNPATKGPMTIDPVLDLFCIEVMKAKTFDDAKALGLEAMRKNDVAFAAARDAWTAARENAKTTGARLGAAEQARAREDAKLATIRTKHPTEAEHAKARDDAQNELNRIRGLERMLADAQGGSSQDREERERKKLDAEILKRLLDRTDKLDVLQRLKTATEGYDEKTKGAEASRKEVARLKAAEATARSTHETAQRQVMEAGAEASLVQTRRDGMARCAQERMAQLHPTTASKLRELDELLARIETRLAEFDKKAPQMALGCTPMLAEIEALQREAVALGRDADALTAKAATPQAGAADAQRRFNQASQAERDARSAATAISGNKTHAVKAAQDACQVSDAIVKNLADPAARARLTDVQRSRAEAEQDVAQTAAALGRIRAAHASALAAGSLLTPLAGDLAGLKNRAAEWRRRRDATARKAGELADLDRAVEMVVAELAPRLATATTATGSHEQLEWLREFRIRELLDRARKIDRACVARIAPTFMAADKANYDAIAKINSATTAVANAGVLADPPNFGAEIERIYNAARTEAEAVAAEATKAVRCEAAARNALANPPACKGTPPAGAVLKPDPSRKGGLTCLYRCGTSSIEFTVFDGTATCPPKIEDYALVSSSKVPVGGATLVQSGPAVVKKGTSSRSGVQEYSMEFTATTARQVEVDGTAYRREIQWKFTAPPVSLSPGEEIRIDVSGKAEVTDKGAKIKLPTAASAGVRVRGLEKVSGELAWANTGEAKNSTFVFRVPADAKGATIELAADWNLGTFAVYRYGDHKP